MAKGGKAVSETGTLKVYSTIERNRIRAALIAYKEEHDVGAPTLRKLIMDRDPLARELPLSNLQRFISDSHKTQDAYVGMFKAFLEAEGIELPEEETHPLESFGNSIASFILPLDDKGPSQELWDVLPGHYQPIEGSFPAIGLQIEDVPGAAHMTVSETQVYHLPDGVYRYEGVLATHGSLVLIMLRNELTHQPRTYWLERIETAEGYDDRYLTGEVVEPLFHRTGGDGEIIRREKLTFNAREDKDVHG